jgi:hypothetical protein
MLLDSFSLQELEHLHSHEQSHHGCSEQRHDERRQGCSSHLAPQPALTAMINFVNKGDNFVSPQSLRRHLHPVQHFAAQFGITKPSSSISVIPRQWKWLFTTKPRPSSLRDRQHLEIFLDELSKIAAPSLVTTRLTSPPYLWKPIEHGASTRALAHHNGLVVTVPASAVSVDGTLPVDGQASTLHGTGYKLRRPAGVLGWTCLPSWQPLGFHLAAPDRPAAQPG